MPDIAEVEGWDGEDAVVEEELFEDDDSAMLSTLSATLESALLKRCIFVKKMMWTIIRIMVRFSNYLNVTIGRFSFQIIGRREIVKINVNPVKIKG